MTVSQALPIIDPHSAMRLANVATYVWPLVVTIAVALIRWRQLRHRTGFIVLGYLVCIGVAALFSRFGWIVYWLKIAPTVVEDEVVSTLVNASITVSVFGTLLSILPVLWLSRMLSPSKE